jgi:hypothetical protein
VRARSKFWLTALTALLAGRFYWGHEVRAFHPCGSDKAYWVKADARTLQLLREQYGKPYESLYVEALGTIDTSSERDGFARHYDGFFHLRKVVRVANEVPKHCAK